MEWCEHMYQGKVVECSKELIGETWMFCPICGKERPKEKEKLWEKLSEWNPKAVSLKDYANCAIDEFIKKIDEVDKERWNREATIYELKAKLEALR